MEGTNSDHLPSEPVPEDSAPLEEANMEESSEGNESRNSVADDVSLNYCLEFGLLFPLKVSLFPVKSSPSVLLDAGSCEPILLLVDGDPTVSDRSGNEISAEIADMPGQGVQLRRKNRKSLMRRRSTSVPDLDKLTLLPTNSPSHLLDNAKFHYPSTSTTSPSQNFYHNAPHCLIECDNEQNQNACNSHYAITGNENWRSNRTDNDNLLRTSPYQHHLQARSRDAMGIQISGAKSLPRIAQLVEDSQLRRNQTQHKSGSLTTLPSFPTSPLKNSDGHAGSIGDWMNDIIKNRQEDQRQVPLPLDTVTNQKRTSTQTSFHSGTTATERSSNTNSIGLSSSPSPPGSHCPSSKSIPKLNIYAVEGSSPVVENEESRISIGSSVRSLNRLFVIHGYDDNEGVITISGPGTPSRRSSRSRSGSFTGSETSASSFRIHSRGESPVPLLPSSSSCCGVSLRGSPLPTSPPYQSTCSDAVTFRQCFKATPTTSRNSALQCPTYGSSGVGSSGCICESSSSHGRASPISGNVHVHSASDFGTCTDDLDVFRDEPSDFPAIDPSFGLHFKGIADGRKRGVMAIALSEEHCREIISREISDSLQGRDCEVGCGNASQKSNHHHQPLPGTKVVSVRKRSRVKSGRGGGTASSSTSSSCCSKGHPEDTEKCAELQVIMPTIERAKRLSRLIQHRQHLQLQYSLNLNFLVWQIFYNDFTHLLSLRFCVASFLVPILLCNS